MNYFKSFYNNKLSYSPGWYGEMPWAPKAEVLLYNDKEGFCIGRMESELPQQVEPMDKKTALAEIEKYKDDTTSIEVADKHDRKPARVWHGQDLADRWLPEAIEQKPSDPELAVADAEEIIAGRKATGYHFHFCPICHKGVCRINEYDDGSISIVQDGKTLIQRILTKSIILSCPSGHKVKVNCG
jgi:hypothetical protein